MALTEEPLLSKLQRLDNIMKQLEGMRGVQSKSAPDPGSSGESTPTSSDGQSSVDAWSESMEKYCRPMYDVFMETKVKGTLIERITHVEDQLVKLCMQMMQAAETEEEERSVGCGGGPWKKKKKKSKDKKAGGFKGLVQSVIKVGHS